MNRIFCILLTLSIIALSLCACGTQGEQSNGSESDNKADTSQQSNEVTSTEAPTTEPATEAAYENTNFIAQPPQGEMKYTAKEIFVDNNGHASHPDTSGNYLTIAMDTSDDIGYYDVIYDLDGNLIVNLKDLALEKGYLEYARVHGIYNDYVVVELTPAILKHKYFLYNLKTKEMTDIGDYVSLDNDGEVSLDYGGIIIYKCNSDSSKYGALDLELKEIIPCEYNGLMAASPELLIANKDGKCGLIDMNNNVVVDFKYESILPFSGYKIYDNKLLRRLMDYDKNINNYTVALTEDKKYILIDNKGTEIPLSYSIAEYHEHKDGKEHDTTNEGRVISQYNNVTYVLHDDEKTYLEITSDTLFKMISDLDGNTIVNNVSKSENSGFINGYCIKADSDNKNYCLVDTNGKTVYSQKNVRIYPVDQMGLFLVESEENKQVMDLNSNVAYTFENTKCTVDPLGNGLFAVKNFTKKFNFNLSIYKISAE